MEVMNSTSLTSGGGYWFFDHSAWNGLTWADLVFPWFIFMMGTAIPIAFKSQLDKGATKKELFLKTVRRSIILFGLGLFLNNGSHVPTWRIPGVLQRFGIAYFVVACVFIFVPAMSYVSQSLQISKYFRTMIPKLKMLVC
jgi:heparan-alpha-glucosaminide N-acetyltransferase